MAARYDSDEDLQGFSSGEREISLGTGTVLGVFFALALVCALFFGLGYSMGRRSAPSPVQSVVPPETPALAANGSKPGAGSSSPARGRANQDALVGDPISAGDPTTQETESSPATESPKSRVLAPPVHEPAAPPSTPTPKQAAAPVSAAIAAAANPSGSSSFVQVAAVTHKEDADLLLTALKRRGYAGAIRQTPQDKLLHIQLGPFSTKKDAEAMKQRLITDGYNPIIK